VLLAEKDEIIKAVMAEGEELSKKQAVQEGVIKKMRAKLKEAEVEAQRLASRLQVEETRVLSIQEVSTFHPPFFALWPCGCLPALASRYTRVRVV